MNSKKVFLLLFVFINAVTLKAQKYVEVTSEVITVNSQTAMSGNTRNIARVSLPPKTLGYIFRVSIFPKGGVNMLNSLTEVLEDIDPKAALVSSLMQLAVKNNDGTSVDAFVFNSVYDQDNFLNKQDGNWAACKTMLNRSNFCLVSKECLNKEIYFGFRNNNLSKGLDVKLEIVAIVDESKISDYNYSYTILNGTDREVKYFISTDGKSWKESNVRSGYQSIFTLEQDVAYFRIYTTTYKYVQYQITAADRFKILWNPNNQKWDLVRF